MNNNTYMQLSGRTEIATDVGCVARDSLHHTAETLVENRTDSNASHLSSYGHSVHKVTESAPEESTHSATHGEIRARKRRKPVQRHKESHKANDSDLHSASEKPLNQPNLLLTDAHRRALRVIWDNVSEEGRSHLPSLASRKDWAAAHGLDSHNAVSSWFSRTRARKRKNQKENNLVKEDVVEISKDDAMKEWRLVLEDDGTWKMKRVSVEFLKLSPFKKSSCEDETSNNVTIKTEEITIKTGEIPYSDDPYRSLPFNSFSLSLTPAVTNRNVETLGKAQGTSQQSISKCSVLQPIQNLESGAPATNNTPSRILEQRMLVSTPSIRQQNEYNPQITPASPFTPALSPAQSVLSPSSTYNFPITPRDQFHTFPQTCGPHDFSITPRDRLFTFPQSSCNETEIDDSFYEAHIEENRYIDAKDDFQSRFSEYTRASVPNQTIKNSEGLSDLFHAASLQSPLRPNASDYHILRSLSPDHYTCPKETHPISLGAPLQLQQSALKHKDFVCDTNPDTTHLKIGHETGRSGVNQPTFAVYPAESHYGPISNRTQGRQNFENSVFSIRASNDHAFRKHNYVQKSPRFIVQGPRTDVTLIPSSFPELSAIPYLDGVTRHSKELLAAKGKADEVGNIFTGTKEIIPWGPDCYNSANSDLMLIDRLSMLPQLSLDEYFSQWTQDALNDLANLSKELDFDDMQINVGSQVQSFAICPGKSDITTQCGFTAPDLKFLTAGC